VATVALYEVERLYMASDRLPSVEIIGDGIPADIVFSALTKHSREFVERMPRVPCDEYLELCSGAAPAALIAARDFAGHATATDIAERATRFAEFNARLNGIANATMVQGDVYEPVLGKTFDVITAHPPYIPSFDNALVFRDGGEDGEQVVRVILEGLARHLRPGGQFYATCMITSRTGQSVEQRIRSMLGDAQGEFDLLIGVAKAAPPWEMFAGSLRDGTSTPDLYVRRLAAFEALGITEFVAGAFMIQRRATERPVGTRRRSLTPQTTWGDLQWALRYMAATSDWSAENVDVLLDARPCTLPGTRIETRSVLRDGSWNVSAAHLVSSAPFSVKAPCLPWFPPLLSWCDGTATVRELYRRLLGLPEFDRNGTEADFALLLYQLADAPFIELSAIPVVT
jgi:SAM-dependent methyltransferase